MSIIAPLLNALAEGAFLITPNNRLAIEITNDFYNFHKKKIIAKPLCMPYENFLIHLFTAYCAANSRKKFPVILNAHTIRFLWMQIIGDQFTQGLLSAVEEAWNRCQRWNINLTHPDFLLTPQTAQFQQWCYQFQNKLNQLQAITSAQIVSFLIEEKYIIQPGLYIWHCFDDYSPQQQALQSYFQAQGAKIKLTNITREQPLAFLYQAEDENTEIEQLLLWLTPLLAKNEQRIGIVMPQIEKSGEALLRKLKSRFPDAYFNISLGKSLSSYPIIAHALEWLKLDMKFLPLDKAQLLLHSPYLAASKEEFIPRAQCLQNCQSLQEVVIDPLQFIQEISKRAPQLANMLQKITGYPATASIAEWISLFIQRLLQMGFPGDSALNSFNYQCYQRFLLIFDEFKTCKIITEILSQTEALAWFSSLAFNTSFQPQTLHKHIEILGLLEASGRTFNHLWILGITQDCLPQKVQLSAFIPNTLQKNYKMPKADAEREYYLAATQVHRFIHSVPLCIFSYPRLSGDTPNLPSPLLLTLPAYEGQKILVDNTHTDLETYEEQYTFPLETQDVIHGGTAILAHQAQCPFKAFAAHRLHLKKNIAHSYGLNPMERGQALHTAMEYIWRHLENQHNLLQSSVEFLNDLTTKAIEKGLAPLKQSRPYSFPTLIAEVESIRLRALIYTCLAWDKERPTFTVEKIEEEFIYHFEGLAIKMRVDRLDQSGSKKWIVDYKRSLPTSLPWQEERPQEPQLLLYALLDESIETIVYLALKAGKLECRGLSAENWAIKGLLPLKERTFENERSLWKTKLHALAQEFRQGICLPQPLQANICKRCDYQSLCRYNQNTALSE